MPIVLPGIDPRAWSRERLPTTPPLPYVSRRAIGKVKDRVAKPDTCHYCFAPVVLVNNEEVYGGRSLGEWPFVYLCTRCRAYVSLHPKTDLPLGALADCDTRDMRRLAKQPFKLLTRTKFCGDRNKAYDWLAASLTISRHECHFAFFDYELAFKAFNICFDEACYYG